MIAVVALNYNDCQTMISYIDSISGYSNIGRIVIVDNQSTDDSYDKLKSYYNQSEKVVVISSEYNGGYGYGNNFGVRYTIEKFKSEFILITNSDVHYSEATLEALENMMLSRRDIGVVAPRMLDSSGNITVNCAWKIPNSKEFVRALIGNRSKLHLSYDYNNNELYKYVDCVPGSLLLVRSKAFQNIQGYDEGIFLFAEETVLGIRLKEKGWKTILLLNSTFVHDHSVSINKTYKSKKKTDLLMWKSRKYILKKYYKFNELELAIIGIAVKLKIEASAFKHGPWNRFKRGIIG